MLYSGLKSLHLIFAIAWMAGLLYIGRLFVYWVEATSSDVKQTLAIMAHRLQRYIILPSSIGTILIGAHLIGVIGALSMGWFHLKLFYLFLLFGYQHVCSSFTKKLSLNTFNKSSQWCRKFNEIPIILLLVLCFRLLLKIFNYQSLHQQLCSVY